MFNDTLDAIRREFSGDAAKNQVAAISRFHRIQASPGLRRAAQYLMEQLQAWGLQPEHLRWPATASARFWGQSSFQEWDARSATLHVVTPAHAAGRKLADYRAVPLSLVARSIPYQGDLEVVVIAGGDRVEDYDGIDVRGKLVLSNLEPMQVRALAVERFGAAGLIFDGMRQAPPVRLAYDLPDAIQYTSFWWFNGKQPDCFGFALSQQTGAWLRSLIAGSPEPVRLRAAVDTHFYDGELDGVTVQIPGRTEDEVLVVAHLCHPAPCANDNASGAACAMELARTLQTLIANGRLPQPQRTIRFLWVPEMTGSVAYLATHEAAIPHMVAGLNLDMVGENQALCGSSLLLERPAASMASFVSALLERIHEELATDVPGFGGQGGYASYRHAVVPFTGGSDHIIFSDPTVGVPMPMLIQWPDRFYHTTADTLEKTDPHSLTLAGALAGTYAFFIANAGADEAMWLADELLARFKGELARSIQRATGATLDGLQRRVDFALDRQQAALAGLTRLYPALDVGPWQTEAAEFAGAEGRRGERAPRQASGPGAAAGRSAPADESHTPAAPRDAGRRRVPTRRVRGPVSIDGSPTSLAEADREAWRAFVKTHGLEGSVVPTVTLYWADGRRSVAEIAELVDLELGTLDQEIVPRYFEFMEKAGLVSMAPLSGD